MDALLVILIILLLFFGGGTWYSYSPRGWGPGPGGLFGLLFAIILITVVLKLLGVL